MAEIAFLPQSFQVITEEGFRTKREAGICLSTRETTRARWPCSGKLEDVATRACAPHWKGDVGTRDEAVDGDSHKITPLRALAGFNHAAAPWILGAKVRTG